MAANRSRRNRHPNVAVRFDLGEFTRRLGCLFGGEAEFTGPGPAQFRPSTTGCGHSPAGRFALDYLFSEIFSKFDDKKSNEAKTAACAERFVQAEELCRDTNWRFSRREFLYSGVLATGYTPAKAMWLARRKIELLLGDFQWDDAFDRGGFGPGATSRLARHNNHLSSKMGGVPHATKAASSLVPALLERHTPWRAYFGQGAVCEIVNGNKLVTVPKNYKTDRAIAIEPEWNLFLQKGIGSMLRTRLQRLGIDLRDQSNNWFLAGYGSLTGEFATIDLSMASDCLARELVRFLLPADWYDALEQCRSPVGVLPSDRVVPYQKFSSMGNGATFELETLIFWGLASAVVDLMRLENRSVLVYGDDIIVPTQAYENVCDVLVVAGFVPNDKKSFGSGPFRESCGGHFYEGAEVTPFYIREAVDRLDRLFLLHNNLCRYLQRMGPELDLDSVEVIRLLSWVRSFAPKQWQTPCLPRLDIGDGAFYGSFEETTPSRRRLGNGWDGWSVKTLQGEPLERDHGNGPYEQYIARLWENSLVPSFYGLPDQWAIRRARHRGESPLNEEVVIPRWADPSQMQDSRKIHWAIRSQTVHGNADYCWWHF